MGRSAEISSPTVADQPAFTGQVAPEVYVRLFEHCRDGMAVLDGSLRVLDINAAGCAIVGYTRDQLVGRPALLPVSADAADSTREDLLGSLLGQTGRRTTRITRPDGQQRDIEYADTLIDSEGGPLLTAVFRDVTDERRTLRRQETLAQVAARVAYARSLEDTLATLAACLVESTDMIACAAIVLDGEPPQLRIAGSAGLPTDYAERFRRALHDDTTGDLPSVRAFRGGGTVVANRVDNTGPPVPVEHLDGELDWASIACFPMRARNRSVGVIKTFWRGPPPSGDELRFLAAVVDQAAVAVDNAGLLAEAAESARRDEALVAAGLALASELSLPAVLTKIVKLACDVAQAKYGAVAVLGPDGLLEDFITHGIGEDERTAIGPLPIGRGILGALISDAHPLRLARIQDDPRSIGFPEHHPAMTSFLGVPIAVRGKVYGNLYLTEKRGATEFTQGDERAAVTLAAQAGVAIENARLFAEAQQRLALEARHKLARELHDSVSQALFSMTLESRGAQLALERSGISSDGPLGARLTRLRQLTQGALAEMRALIFELRPEALREEGLVAAIRKQADGLSGRADVNVAVQAPPDRLALPPDVEQQVYRLVQEALANIAKHSCARNAMVRLEIRGGLRPKLLVRVRDDGVGFDPSSRHPGHLGLRTMAQRADQLGGSFTLKTAPGQGTTVSAVLPLPIPEAPGTVTGERGRTRRRHA